MCAICIIVKDFSFLNFLLLTKYTFKNKIRKTKKKVVICTLNWIEKKKDQSKRRVGKIGANGKFKIKITTAAEKVSVR